MTGYYCKACEAPATVDAAGIHRTCDCNTTIIAGMAAHAKGVGGVQEASMLSRFLGLVKMTARRYLDGRV